MNNDGGINNIKGRNDFRCLIVEDNIHAAEIMAIFFERNGIASETAENGKKGLQMYFDRPLEYDIIFIDLQMPVMDGYEMARRIRGSGVLNSCAVPLVAMSGTYTGDTAAKGNFDFFLKKPFEMRCLTGIINEIRRRQ